MSINRASMINLPSSLVRASFAGASLIQPLFRPIEDGPIPFAPAPDHPGPGMNIIRPLVENFFANLLNIRRPSEEHPLSLSEALLVNRTPLTLPLTLSALREWVSENKAPFSLERRNSLDTTSIREGIPLSALPGLHPGAYSASRAYSARVRPASSPNRTPYEKPSPKTPGSSQGPVKNEAGERVFGARVTRGSANRRGQTR